MSDQFFNMIIIKEISKTSHLNIIIITLYYFTYLLYKMV